MAKSAIRHNMKKELPKITIPTCIIWGENDKVTPPKVAEEFHNLISSSQLFWIQKCGHAAMMERPDIFNKIVIKWIHTLKNESHKS
jgi:pimeloyl-ACP methyl ester carboxylesterase